MKIEHIALYVENLEAAKEFFSKYFCGKANGGYHNEKTGFRSYFISFDDGTRLEIMTRPDIVDSERSVYRSGYAHIAFSLGSKEKVDTLTDRMKNDGYTVISGPRTTGDGYYESCLAAFEENLIELTV